MSAASLLPLRRFEGATARIALAPDGAVALLEWGGRVARLRLDGPGAEVPEVVRERPPVTGGYEAVGWTPAPSGVIRCMGRRWIDPFEADARELPPQCLAGHSTDDGRFIVVPGRRRSWAWRVDPTRADGVERSHLLPAIDDRHLGRVAASPSGATLVASFLPDAGGGRPALLFLRQPGEEPALERPLEALASVWVDERWVVGGGEDGWLRIRAIEPPRVRLVAEERAHRPRVEQVAASPDLRWIVTAGVDGPPALWRFDAAAGRLQRVADLSGAPGPRAVACSNRFVLAGTALEDDRGAATGATVVWSLPA